MEDAATANERGVPPFLGGSDGKGWQEIRDPNTGRRQPSIFQPATLEQRGAAVPFTTPSLSLSRVRRDDRHEMVLLLSGFGGGEGAYVVPWRAVPELGPMSVHDRALHEQIYDNRALTPLLMRQCVLRVAATGLAGPAAAEAARQAVELEDRKTLETHFLIIISLLMAVGVDVGELVAADPAKGAWRTRARTLLNDVSVRMGYDPGQFYARSAALARVVAPVGLAQAPSGSRYRKLLNELDQFRESSAGWGSAERSDVGRSALSAADMANRTIEIVSGVLRQFDKRTTDDGWLLRDWQRESAVAAAISNRLSWLLDGWDHIVALWDQALGEDISAQRDTMAQILPALPVIPRSEAGDDNRGMPPLPAGVGRFRSSKADLEMTIRLEAAKAKAVPK